jgi:ATP-dependent exoDNAse (exonuclease V) beta subunit
MGAVLRPDRCTGWSCERLEVRAEMAFAADLPAGPMRGRMDRVVLGVRGGRVVRAEVVDWKTGARGLSGAALEERIAPYRAQMADYRAALAAMLGLEPACVTAVLAMVDRGELIEA